MPGVRESLLFSLTSRVFLSDGEIPPPYSDARAAAAHSSARTGGGRGAACCNADPSEGELSPGEICS
eukprot:4425510-Pleurochrysis_carterae.AAC.1